MKDEDGCPEIFDDESGNVANGDGNVCVGLECEEILVTPGDSSICGFIDWRAQIRKDDSIWAAIVKDDENVIFSKSEKRQLSITN